jgi:hypothetical protein
MIRYAIIILLAAASLQSCSRCKRCTETSTTIITDVNGKVLSESKPTYKTYKACGSHLKEVDGETTTTYSTDDNKITYTTTSTTNCQAE